MKKRLTAVILASAIACSLSACGSTTVTNTSVDKTEVNEADTTEIESLDSSEQVTSEGLSAEEEMIEDTGSESQDQSVEMLDFVDAFGNSYTVEIQPNWKKHGYDWDYLTETDGIKSYDDGTYRTRLGIDISEYQTDIDWEAVKASGVEFVILRLGYRGYGEEGNIYLDEMFEEHYKNAKAAGLDVGVYFFSQAVNEEETREEAEFVMKHLQGKELECPVFFDSEHILDDVARTDDVTGEQFTENAVCFCELLSDAGYTPMIYSNMLWEAYQYDLSQLEQYGVWYADYEEIPQTPYNLCYWQYSENGTLDGIQGTLDLDVQFVPVSD